LVSAPEKDDVQLPTEDAVLAVFQDIEEREIGPWVDNTLDRPLLTEMPVPGTVTETTTYDQLGVTEWT